MQFMVIKACKNSQIFFDCHYIQLNKAQHDPIQHKQSLSNVSECCYAKCNYFDILRVILPSVFIQMNVMLPCTIFCKKCLKFITEYQIFSVNLFKSQNSESLPKTVKP